MTKIRSKIDLSEADLHKYIRILKLKSLVDEVKSDLTSEEYEKAKSINFPITTFERFFTSTKVRDEWGLDFDGVDYKISSNFQSFLKANSQVIKRILLPKGNVDRIDSRNINGDDIIAVLEKLPKVEAEEDIDQNLSPDQEAGSSTIQTETDETTEPEDNSSSSSPFKKKVLAKDDPNRPRLIPRCYHVVSNQHRLADIFDELKEIPFRYSNAIASSIRVILDLSVLSYIKENMKRK